MMCGRVVLNLMKMELGLTAKLSSCSSEIVSRNINFVYDGNYGSGQHIRMTFLHIYMATNDGKLAQPLRAPKTPVYKILTRRVVVDAAV